jgi:hypothetical protein
VRTRRLMPTTATAHLTQRSRSHHGPPAVELVGALMGSALIRESLPYGKRKPSTLAALERRWFVGRLSLAKAQEKHKSLSKAQLSDSRLGGNLELIGTAGLLRMASPGAGPNLVTVRASAWADWYEFLLYVPVRKRGKLPSINRTGTSKSWSRNRLAMGTKKYYVHADVVAAAKSYIEAFETRKHLRISMQTTPDYQGRCTSTINLDAGAAAGAMPCVLSPATTIEGLAKLSSTRCFMSMSDPGETYGEPDSYAVDFMAGAMGACTLSHPEEAAISHGPILIDDDLQWIDETCY